LIENLEDDVHVIVPGGDPVATAFDDAVGASDGAEQPAPTRGDELFPVSNHDVAVLPVDTVASAGLFDHAIVFDRKSAGDGNGGSAPSHLQVTVRADHARVAYESLCSGDAVVDWVRAGIELGSPCRRSEKSESDQRESHEENFQGL